MKTLILTAALLLSTAAQAQVPTFTSSGDLSSVTRHSFITGQIINPKSWPDFTHNSSLNAANGAFTTGSQAWHTAGSYVFTIPPGFTKLEVIGCGAGGLSEQHTWWNSVAATGGGGSGSCFRAILTGLPGSQFLFRPASKNGITPTQISVAQNNFSRLFALGFNGGRGGRPSYNGGWIDGVPGGGASTSEGSKGTYTSLTGSSGYAIAPGARMEAIGKNAISYRGALVTKTLYSNATFTNYCRGGRGADGIAMGATNTPAAAEDGCVMVKW